MRIGLGQFDAVVGDLEGNAERMREFYGQAIEKKVDLLVFPELAVCSYPPEDLLLKKHFLDDNRQVVEKLAKSPTQQWSSVSRFIIAGKLTTLRGCYRMVGWQMFIARVFCQTKAFSMSNGILSRATSR
jgi:predicted amidohydrolase